MMRVASSNKETIDVGSKRIHLSLSRTTSSAGDLEEVNKLNALILVSVFVSLLISSVFWFQSFSLLASVFDGIRLVWGLETGSELVMWRCAME